MSIQDISSEEEFQKATRDSNYKSTVAFFDDGYSNARNSQIKFADFEALSKVYPTLKFISLNVNLNMEVSQIFEQYEAFDWPNCQVTTYNFTLFIISILFLLG